jgi:hypothetical protein
LASSCWSFRNNFECCCVFARWEHFNWHNCKECLGIDMSSKQRFDEDLMVFCWYGNLGNRILCIERSGRS